MSIEVRQLTAPGAGGVSVVKVWGTDAFERVRNLAPRLRADVPEPQLVRLRVGDEDLDEALLCVISRAEIELHVHGSPPLVRRVVEFLGVEHEDGSGGGSGDAASPPGRATKSVEERAWVHLSRAASDSGARILLDQADGALRRALASLRLKCAAERATAVEQLLEHGRVARFALEPIEVVLAGAVNSGKSTLFNLLLGEDRVIVSDEEGTTRDVVRERAQIGAYPISLTDTAGEREWHGPGSRELLERASQLHALRARQQAELILWLVRADSVGTHFSRPTSTSDVRGKPRDGDSAAPELESITDRSSRVELGRVQREIVHTQLDRIDPVGRARFQGAISAMHEPEVARLRIHEIFHAAFELPDEPWVSGRAVPFDAELMHGLNLLALDAPPDEWTHQLTALLGVP